LQETIAEMVKQIDQPASDITELRVFHLANADPLEMADLFSQLFPDDSKTSNDANQNQPGFRFRGFGGALFNNANQNSTPSSSDRLKKKSRVLAVPDARTSSIIVSAASELMPQIAEMIAQLDSSPAKKQRVFVYSLENADVQQVQQILQDMFQRNNTQVNRNNPNQNNALVNRSQSNNQGTTGATGIGTSGLGNNPSLNGGQAQPFR